MILIAYPYSLSDILWPSVSNTLTKSTKITKIFWLLSVLLQIKSLTESKASSVPLLLTKPNYLSAIILFCINNSNSLLWTILSKILKMQIKFFENNKSMAFTAFR